MPAPLDPDLYANDRLGFEIRKPGHWLFLATPWAVNLRKRSTLSNDELRRVMAHASAPFVYAHLPHDTPDSCFPTLQASCRVVGSQLDPETLLPQLVSQLARQFPDLELLDKNAHAIVGGAKAILIKSRFTVRNAEGTKFRCLSRNYTLFSGQLAFAVGITCAAQGEYCVEREVDAVSSSIRVRQKTARGGQYRVTVDIHSCD